MYIESGQSRSLIIHYLFFLSYLVAYRVYNYSVFAATSVGEGPSADGSFLTREDGEFITIMFFWVSISIIFCVAMRV